MDNRPVETNQVRPPSSSPHWGWTTKLVATLALLTVSGFLFIKFQNLMAPLLLAMILVYLFYPLAARITRWTRIPWRISVSLLYLLLLIVLFGLLTWGGLALFDQLQSLINLLQRALVSLPAFIQNLSQQRYAIGPFSIDLTTLDLNALSSQVLSWVQPMLGRVGGLVGTIATGAAGLFGWLFFILLISYFILAESEGIPSRAIQVHIPGYDADLRRIARELSKTWNAFLRGQLIVTGLTVLIYTGLLGGMGVHYYLGLALMAGLAKFIPYVGPGIAWTTYGLVAFFQGSSPFGLAPFSYAILVVAVALIVDNIFDSLVTPRILAEALRVHPAAVLLAAILGASFLGLVGVVLAAPVLATIKLIFNYIMRKLFDQDPWEGLDLLPANPPPAPFIRQLRRVWNAIKVRLPRRGA